MNCSHLYLAGSFLLWDALKISVLVWLLRLTWTNKRVFIVLCTYIVLRSPSIHFCEAIPASPNGRYIHCLNTEILESSLIPFPKCMNVMSLSSHSYTKTEMCIRSFSVYPLCIIQSCNTHSHACRRAWKCTHPESCPSVSRRVRSSH